MILLVLALVAVALVVVVVGVAFGRIPADPLAPDTHSAPDHGLPPNPMASDVDGVRFDTAPSGYHPGDVDPHLDLLRDQLDERERRLAGLRQDPVD